MLENFSVIRLHHFSQHFEHSDQLKAAAVDFALIKIRDYLT